MLKWNKDLPVEYWIAAAEFLATYDGGYAHWYKDELNELHFSVSCSDVFVPAADGHDINPEQVFEVLAIAQKEIDYGKQNLNVMRWVAKQIGFEDESKWWCNRKKTS